MGRPVLPLRDRAALKSEWLTTRLDTVVPKIMRDAGVDCWVLIAREYNDDPALKTMLPATWETARRRTILVFTEFGETRVSISRYDLDTLFAGVWDPSTQPDQWQCLADHLAEQSPRRIAINRSETFPLADGLSSSEAARLLAALPPSLCNRLEPSDALAVGWLETRIAPEIAAFPDVCARAHGILRDALSATVITPGATTTQDVEWWLREEARFCGYQTWFHPTVSLQRSGGDADDVIRHGDLVHIDFGIEYLTLHTDQQQHGYVLLPDETAPPPGLRTALEVGNRLQDIVMAQFRTGVTGNAILRSAHRIAEEEGIAATIYSHPIGLHGHGAGPTIGLWDNQRGVAGTGDYPVRPDTAYSIELAVEVSVPEWDDQPVHIMLEEDAFFDGNVFELLDGRQTELWTV
jgi:hypothetical protein